MKFIEMTAAKLRNFVELDEGVRQALAEMHLNPDDIVRINQQGDIEVRRHDRWDVIGGLLGEFEPRLHETTGLDWA